jgi:hypothetical protein
MIVGLELWIRAVSPKHAATPTRNLSFHLQVRIVPLVKHRLKGAGQNRIIACPWLSHSRSMPLQILRNGPMRSKLPGIWRAPQRRSSRIRVLSCLAALPKKTSRRSSLARLDRFHQQTRFRTTFGQEEGSAWPHTMILWNRPMKINRVEGASSPAVRQLSCRYSSGRKLDYNESPLVVVRSYPSSSLNLPFGQWIAHNLGVVVGATRASGRDPKSFPSGRKPALS